MSFFMITRQIFPKMNILRDTPHYLMAFKLESTGLMEPGSLVFDLD